MSCEHTAERLMLYLAGVLDAAEERAIETHLQHGCTPCELRLVEARRLLDELPLALEPREPRPVARERLLAQLEAAGAGDRAPLRLVGDEPRPVVRRSRSAVARLFGACAAAAAVAASVTFAVVDQQVQQQADELAQLREKVSEYDEQLAAYSTRATRLERLAAVAGDLYATLRSSPLEMVRMVGVDEYENASARLIWDRSRNVGHFVGPEGFIPANGRRLELWLTAAGDDQKALSAGTFSLDEFGWARFDMGTTETDFSSFDRAYISYDGEDTPSEADAQRPRQVLLSGNF